MTPTEALATLQKYLDENDVGSFQEMQDIKDTLGSALAESGAMLLWMNERRVQFTTMHNPVGGFFYYDPPTGGNSYVAFKDATIDGIKAAIRKAMEEKP